MPISSPLSSRPTSAPNLASGRRLPRHGFAKTLSAGLAKGLSGALAPKPAPNTPALISLGAPQADGWLGGGLASNGLHEAVSHSAHDETAALAFLLLLAERKRRTGLASALIWARAREKGAQGAQGAIPYGPGLLELGLDPASITLLLLPDSLSVLRAGLDALRHGGASVLIELPQKANAYDLTASRRLALAAQESGALALVLRHQPRAATAISPSAAHTRWQVAPAPRDRKSVV